VRFAKKAMLVGLCSVVAASGCQQPPAGDKAPQTTAEDLHDKAQRLAQEILVVDTHIDVPYRLRKGMEEISGRTQRGDFDYARAKAGGLNAAFMSIYVSASYQASGGAKEFADQLIEMVKGFETTWPDKFAVARSPEDIRRHFAQGKLSLPMGMENGAAVEGDLDNLKHFHEAGIRYITLTHSKVNHISDSSYDTERTWNGLSPFGREVVAEMNRLGMMIDVSHITDDAFYQVLELTEAPVIASHSSCRAFTPGWERNMDDDMIRDLGAQGGVIQINFGSAFLREDAQKQSTAYWEAHERYLAQAGFDANHGESEEFKQEYWRNRQRIYADISEVVAHIDHVVELVGIDHVGFGSDFEGVGDSLPTGLKDVSQYPNLIYQLLERGYTEEDIRKISGENLLRVWSEVEQLARRLQAEG
jgi:membrane dipeptidase